jgi:hypothetical protein
MAANCAAFAGTPGGAGGRTGCAIPSNRAPASKPFWRKNTLFRIDTTEKLHHVTSPMLM